MKSIIIVGGGTAGWLAAAYLRRALRETVSITLIESSAVPPVGVGEATLPTLRNTLAFVGADEPTFMRRCHATFKTAIRYERWATGAAEDSYDNPFFARPEPLIPAFDRPFFPVLGEGCSPALWWMRRAARDEGCAPFARMASPLPALCDAQRFDPELPYAYHLDASQLALYLRELALAGGVKHVVGHVTEVHRHEDGRLAAVDHEGGQLRGDFFLDCTGFRSLLMGGALAEPFLSDADVLPNDGAVALTADRGEELPPYTVARAHRAGWSWRVPLTHRYGCGYVFASRFADADTVEAELREHLGEAAADHEARHIRMRVGRSQRVWVKNCVALGLSAMFIEPLESTAIFFIEMQLGLLLKLLPDGRTDERRAGRYNRWVAEIYEQVRDFVVMHYCTTQREDSPYWAWAKNELTLPDSLAGALDDYRRGLSPVDETRFSVFRAPQWVSVLSGMGHHPEASAPLLEELDAAAADAHFAALAAQTKRLVEAAQPHAEQVARVVAAATPS